MVLPNDIKNPVDSWNNKKVENIYYWILPLLLFKIRLQNVLKSMNISTVYIISVTILYIGLSNIFSTLYF